MKMISGTLTNYTRMAQLQFKAQRRLSGEPLEDEKDAERANLERQADSTRKSIRVSSIVTKLKSGQKLTGKELSYLRSNSPELYRKAVEIAKEREQYKKKLKKCTTKDDVEKAKIEKIQKLANEADTVMRADISDEEKTEKLEFIMMRFYAIQDEHTNFVKSPEYHSLPWQWELDAEKKKKKEAAIEQAAEQGSKKTEQPDEKAPARPDETFEREPERTGELPALPAEIQEIWNEASAFLNGQLQAAGDSLPGGGAWQKFVQPMGAPSAGPAKVGGVHFEARA